MSVDTIIHLLQSAIYSMVIISAPILLASFVMGVFMSLLQAIFQIHEYTFSFVPKLIAIFVALILAAPWMMSEIAKMCHLFLGQGYHYVQ